eukprot:CAMPEP_0194486460 /NCGR_PEP_ID=MMETSP0253-20130528/7100_1 /TAXON_ID=2966 /ORGANISM="Noctiluca scintillans" /LENGTH=188 /DNA_ID=CAMNT_0039326551 /DNA_START=648 /DNA_END=1215 /DNA_ORIENTATION=+
MLAIGVTDCVPICIVPISGDGIGDGLFDIGQTSVHRTQAASFTDIEAGGRHLTVQGDGRGGGGGLANTVDMSSTLAFNSPNMLSMALICATNGFLNSETTTLHSACMSCRSLSQTLALMADLNSSPQHTSTRAPKAFICIFIQAKSALTPTSTLEDNDSQKWAGSGCHSRPNSQSEPGHVSRDSYVNI